MSESTISMAHPNFYDCLSCSTYDTGQMDGRQGRVDHLQWGIRPVPYQDGVERRNDETKQEAEIYGAT